MVNREKLFAKGWTEKEVQKAESILDQVHEHEVRFSKIVFWTALAVVILGNAIISLALVPFLIGLQSRWVFAIVGALGLLMGFLYNYLIIDIQHLEQKHHLIAGILLPLIALVNVFGIVLVANKLLKTAKFAQAAAPLNPWLVGVVFAVAFVVPTVMDRIRLKLHEKKGM